MDTIIKHSCQHSDKFLILKYDSNTKLLLTFYSDYERIGNKINFDIFEAVDKIRDLNIRIYWNIRGDSFEIIDELQKIKSHYRYGDKIIIHVLVHVYKHIYEHITEIIECLNFECNAKIILYNKKSDILYERINELNEYFKDSKHNIQICYEEF